jgi:hypothetical protein
VVFEATGSVVWLGDEDVVEIGWAEVGVACDATTVVDFASETDEVETMFSETGDTRGNGAVADAVSERPGNEEGNWERFGIAVRSMADRKEENAPR